MGFFSEFYNLKWKLGKFRSELWMSVYNSWIIVKKWVGKQMNGKIIIEGSQIHGILQKKILFCVQCKVQVKTAFPSLVVD